MKKAFKSIVKLILGAMTMCFLSGCEVASNPIHNDSKQITISVITDNHCRVKGESTKAVNKGENAIFYFNFDEGYRFDSATEGTFDQQSNQLMLFSVDYPKTIEVLSRPEGDCVLTIINDDTKGSVTISPNSTGYVRGEEVTIITQPNFGETFLCYSYEKPYRGDYAELTGTPLCFDNTYTFIIENDITIAINYFESSHKYIIDYDLNGGKTIMGNDIIHTDYVPRNKIDPYFPVSLNGNYMLKNGYSLFEYNTKPDGSGESIGIGSKICIDYFEDGYIKLFCQWKKWTSLSCFDYETNNNKITITKIHNIESLQELVIPDLIEGKEVTIINSGAFVGNTSVRYLFLNFHLKEIQEFAFSGFNQLNELTIWTSLRFISDGSLQSNTLKTIHINKNTVAANWATPGYLDITTRADMIYSLKKDAKPLMVIIGHSTILYNHNFLPFKTKWGDSYNFYKYCGTAGIAESFLLYTILPLLSADDYLFIPFYHGTVDNRAISMVNFGYLQYDLDCISCVDYQMDKHFFFQSFVLYSELVVDSLLTLQISPEMAAATGSGDEFGGAISGTNCDDPNNKGSSPDWNISSYVNQNIYAYIRTLFDLMPFDDSHIFLTWNSYNQNNIVSTAARKSFLDFEAMVRSLLPNCIYFDSIEENILPGDHFIPNDMMHLSPRGGDIRIQRWLNEVPL